MFVTTRVWLSSLGYNTNLVKAEEAPKSFADLLDPKWMGKIVKAHPGLQRHHHDGHVPDRARTRLAVSSRSSPGRRVMQVQSSTDPPKKLALGERAVMADGNDYNLIQLMEEGAPVQVVYPTEGTPIDHRADRHLQVRAQSQCGAPVPELAAFAEAQQMLVDFAAQHSVHAQVKEKPGRRKLSDIKLMQDDPAGVEKVGEEIKTRYGQIFKV